MIPKDKQHRAILQKDDKNGPENACGAFTVGSRFMALDERELSGTQFQ